MEVKEIMTFLDEDGNKVELEAIAKIYVDEKEYLILSHVEDEASEDAFVFRVDEENGKEVLNLVQEEEEFKKVRKEYKNLLYHKE